LLNVENEKDSKESSNIPRFRPKRQGSIWSSSDRIKVGPSLCAFKSSS
jgi:hypothetical protein